MDKRSYGTGAPPPPPAHVQIAEYARYLGVLIGPAVAVDIQWNAAFDAYRLRVVKLAASAPGPTGAQTA